MCMSFQVEHSSIKGQSFYFFKGDLMLEEHWKKNNDVVEDVFGNFVTLKNHINIYF